MKIPKGDIVQTTVLDNKTIILIIKTPCRHYTSVILESEDNGKGQNDLYVSEVQRRCGLLDCAKSFF